MRSSESESKTTRCGLRRVHLFEDGGDGVGQFDLRRMKDRVLRFGAQVVVGGNHFVNLQ